MLFHRRKFLRKDGLGLRSMLLGGLIAISAVLPGAKAEANWLTAQELYNEIVGASFQSVELGEKLTMTILPSGAVLAQGDMGNYTGAWYASDQTICIDFQSGPLVGETCSAVKRLGDGHYKTDSGTKIYRVASAHPV